MEPQSRPKLLSDRLYNRLRLVATLLLPSLITLYLTLGQIWSFPKMELIAPTLGAINVFVGALVAFARTLYNASGAQYDGSLEVVDGEDGSTLHLRSVDAFALNTKNEITFKIDRSTA